MPQICVRAPGRVNIIGEHTDYNDGFVCPMAIPLETIVVGTKTENSTRGRIFSLSNHQGMKEVVEFDVTNVSKGNPHWANYVKGVVAEFEFPLQYGFDAVIISSVPLGGGLSSSASLEVAFYTFLEHLVGKTSTRDTKALRCQEAEHKYAGVPCGIMDQTIVTSGEQDKAILIDCSNNELRPISFKSPDLCILIINSNVKHDLATSQYALRRQQCYKVSDKLKVKSLRYVTMDQLLANQNEFDAVSFRRARHVISENNRTVEAADALEKSDFVRLGQLMNQSHDSLRDDYEVSCTELDELVSISRSVKGVFGARMTGGGFGGCAICLVKKSAVDELKTNINEKYSGKATFYEAVPSAGASLICTC